MGPRLPLLVAIASVVLLLWLAIGPVMLAFPRSCSACHGERVSQWQGSGHADVGCQRCHTDRAALLGVGNSLAFSSDLWDALSGRSSNAAIVRDGACVRCHAVEALEQPRGFGTLRMSHSGLSSADYRCVECHDDAAHEPPPGRISGARMSVCARCHNNVSISGDCETCHISAGSTDAARRADPELSKTHGTNWEQLHGMGDLATCTLCHERKKCAGCHGIELPHGTSFPAMHGDLALVDRDACISCHTEAFCVSCHGMDMPHAEGFLADHSRVADGADDAACVWCHTPDNCVDCHVKHVHPGGAADANASSTVDPNSKE